MKLSHTDADLKELGNLIKSGFEGTFKGKKDDSCKVEGIYKTNRKRSFS